MRSIGVGDRVQVVEEMVVGDGPTEWRAAPGELATVVQVDRVPEVGVYCRVTFDNDPGHIAELIWSEWISGTVEAAEHHDDFFFMKLVEEPIDS